MDNMIEGTNIAQFLQLFSGGVLEQMQHHISQHGIKEKKKKKAFSGFLHHPGCKVVACHLL